MPNSSTKKIAHGAMMIALFTVLIIISSYVPLINIVASVFAPLPLAWYAATYNRKSSLAVATVATFVPFLFGGLLMIPYALIFSAAGFAIGDAIRLKGSKVYLFMSTSITLLITFAIEYLISLKLFNVDFIHDSIEMMRESYEKALKMSTEMSGQEVMSLDSLNDAFDMLTTMIPAAVTIGAFLIAFVMISINLPVLRRLKIDVPKFGSFKNMRLPRTVLLYYFIVLCVSLFWKPETDSIAYMIILNASMVLWMLLVLQAISLLFFIFDAYRLPGFLKFIVVILAFPLYSFFIFIGILDLGFNIRSFIQSKSEK